MNETANQAGRYLIGAVIALLVDTVAMVILVHWQLPVAAARVIALLLGISTTYFFNRAFTFVTAAPASLRDWSRYVAAQSVGSALNFAISTSVVFFLGRTPLLVALGVCAGAGVGFCYNFFAARRLLHKPDTEKQ